MRRTSLAGFVGTVVLALAPLDAQDLEEVFCENEPNCSDDVLSLVFEGEGANGNVFTYTTFTQDMEIDATVRLNLVTPEVKGWSYAVRHTDGDLFLAGDQALTMEGTDGGAALAFNRFVINRVVRDVFDGEERVGFMSAVVLDTAEGLKTLPTGDNSVLKVTYQLGRDVGPEGTIARFADREIGVPGSPVVDINIAGAQSAIPRLLVHGLVRRAEVECVPTADNEISGQTCNDGIDNDCDDLIDDADPDCEVASPGGCPEGTPPDALYFGAVGGDHQLDGTTVPIVSRNTADLLGFSFGVSIQAAADSQTWSFSSELGHNDQLGNPVLVDMDFTNSDGSSSVPAGGNSLTAATEDPVTTISRGSAISAFEDDDFLAVDLDPELGGNGFFVGYVASLSGDIAKVVPATPSPEDACPASELITVTIGGEVRFNRGDANGDGLINVTDGVLVIQNIAGGILPRFPNCPAILDTNADGTNDLSDGVFLLNYIFKKDSPVPPAPFRTCEAGPGECSESNCAG